MFSPLTPADVVIAIGRATRDAARSSEPASDFSRGQLMSAYSASRHLGVELVSFAPELRSFAQELAADLPALDRARSAHEIGDLVAAALDDLRGDPSPHAAELRARLHTALRRLCDREVELLADVIEAPRT